MGIKDILLIILGVSCAKLYVLLRTNMVLKKSIIDHEEFLIKERQHINEKVFQQTELIGAQNNIIAELRDYYKEDEKIFDQFDERLKQLERLQKDKINKPTHRDETINH